MIRELGSYVLITYNGSELGWVDKKALEFSTEVSDVPSSVPVSYKAGISKSGYSIDTMPWGTLGYRTIGDSSDYIGQSIEVVKEAKDGTYSLISLNGQLLGWIDSKAIVSHEIEVNSPSSYDTSYSAIINVVNYSIDTKPWGTTGYAMLDQTNGYLGKKVEVVKERNDKKYVLISYDGKLLGWVDKKALKTDGVINTNLTSSQPVNYKAIVAKGSYSIDTKPWGMTGYQTIGNTINYVSKKVDVIRELGSYVLITYNGSELGWVDKKALESD